MNISLFGTSDNPINSQPNVGVTAAGPAPAPPALDQTVTYDKAAGVWVFSSVDTQTGQIVSQLPDVRPFAPTLTKPYAAGDVVKRVV